MYRHRTHIPVDDGGPVTFRWHWPRGMLDKRMSALEMATFVLPHMPSIVPLLAHHRRAQAEFKAMLVQLATAPTKALDELVPWIKSVTRTEEDDIIELSIGAVAVDDGPKHFLVTQ